MKSLISHFIRYPILGNMIMLLFLVFGFLGYKNMKKSFFPENESRMISIQAVYPGSSPEEIEEGIVSRIEDNLKGLTGIERITSKSAENGGTISVEVLKGQDVDKVLQDVKNAVDRISSFPTGMEPPVIYIQEKLGFAISFALTGKVDLKTLKTYAQKIEDDLMAVEGISKVGIAGYPEEEIEIGFRENDLRKFNLTFQEVTEAVRKSNIEVTGGTVKGAREEYLVRARSKGYYADEIKNIVVKTSKEGAVVRLHDVAEVIERWADNPNRSYLNGTPSVVLTLQNTLDEDVIFISDYVKEYLESFNKENTEVKASIIKDQSKYLKQRLDLLTWNGVIGFFLVLALLSMFLNYRLAFWVALSIPIAFAGMFILAALWGITINVISLFGMILVIGILVDDGIVISENIYQHYERGKPAVKAAIDGTLEVLPSVTSAILTTVIGFSMFFFLDGRMGEFIPDMAFVVIATLLISLLEAILILPAHVAHSAALRRDSRKTKIEKVFSDIMDFLRDNCYAPALRFVLSNRFFSFSIFISSLVLTYFAWQGGIIKSTFFPNVERDNINVSLVLPAGTREDITEHWLNHIEKSVNRVNEKLRSQREDNKDVIVNVEKKIGPKSNEGSLNVILLDGEEREIEDIVIANELRKESGSVPGAEKLSFGTDTPFGKAVSVSFLSYDRSQLNDAIDELHTKLEAIPNLKDIVDNDQPGLKEIKINLKPKAYLLGFRLQDVVNQVRQGFFGSEVQRLQRNKDEVKIWVRLKEAERASLDDLGQMRIRTMAGEEFPLEELAYFSVERGITAINHLDGMREIRIEADVASKSVSVSDLVSEIKENIVPEILSKYPSVKASYEGQSRESAKTGKSAGKVGPVVLILMFAIIVITFRSFLQAVIVVLCIPFAFIGIGWGHFLHGSPISILSAYGIIALIGVMVNDSLVFVSSLNGYLKEGMPFKKALYETGVSRFRPILLTSLTTIAGLGPLIVEKSLQAQFLIPMAISIAYGLLVATAIMLLLLPVFLSFFNDVRIYVNWLWEGKKPSEEQVEPAVREKKFELELEHEN